MVILHTPAFGNGVCVGGWERKSYRFFHLHLSTQKFSGELVVAIVFLYCKVASLVKCSSCSQTGTDQSEIISLNVVLN